MIAPNYSAHWKIIGALLGIPKKPLDEIEATFPASPFKCCNRMIETLLETNTSVTWKDVITAIDSPYMKSELSQVMSEDIAGMYIVISGIYIAYI